jgi:hypothetical protein
MTLDYEELIRKAEQLGLSAADLNGTIRDAAAELAAQTTDTGLAMQLHFLSRDCGWSKSKMEELARRKPSAEIAALERKAGELGLEADDLDEVIHDIASDIASSINNQGLYGQIAYWTKEGDASVDQIEEELETIAKEKREQT